MERMDLINDILLCISSKATGLWKFRETFQTHLFEIFIKIHNLFNSSDDSQLIEEYSKTIFKIISEWEMHLVYPSEFLKTLLLAFQSKPDILIPLVDTLEIMDDKNKLDYSTVISEYLIKDDDKLNYNDADCVSDIDGVSLISTTEEDEFIDGIPLE